MSKSISNPELFRTNVRGKLYEIIRDGCIENVDSGIDGIPKIDSQNETISGNIEKSVFNYTIREATAKNIVKKWTNEYFVQLYIDRLRSVYTNLKQGNGFINSIIKGDIDPKLVAFLSHQQIKPERWSEIIQRKQIRDESKLTTGVKSNTSLYTCKRCKSKNCTFYEAQTRSADEASTIFVSCIDCGKNWKM